MDKIKTENKTLKAAMLKQGFKQSHCNNVVMTGGMMKIAHELVADEESEVTQLDAAIRLVVEGTYNHLKNYDKLKANTVNELKPFLHDNPKTH